MTEKEPISYDDLSPALHPLMERFSDQLFKPEDLNLDEAKFDKLFDKHQEVFTQALDSILDMWSSPEHKQTLGHDNVHIAFVRRSFRSNGF